MNETFKYKKIFLSSIAICLGFLTAGVALAAWSGPPSGTPPNCPTGSAGCDAPLNVSATFQAKSGNLGAASLIAPNVTASQYCIGISCITSWPSGGMSQWTTSGSNIYYNGGNVSVGAVANAPYKFTVEPGGAGSGLGITWNNALPGTGETDFYNYGQGGGGGFAFLNYPTPGVSYPTTGATNLMTLLSSGNVGIGTANPGNSLDIQNTGNSQLRLGSTGGNYFDIGRVAANGYFSIQGNQTCCDSIILAPTSGNVGIGQTTPLARLDIYQVITNPGSPLTSGTATNALLRVHNGSTNAVMDIGGMGSSPFSGWIQETDVTNLAASYPLALNPNGGNVGIGTASPSQKLEVNGYIRADSGLTAGSNGVADGSVTSSGNNAGFATVDRTGNGNVSVFYRNGNTTALWDNNAGNVITFNNGGNFAVNGINTGAGQTSVGGVIGSFVDGQNRTVAAIRGGIDGSALPTDASLNLGGNGVLVYSIDANGGIRTRSGGITFPDGSVQTTAAGAAGVKTYGGIYTPGLQSNCTNPNQSGGFGNPIAGGACGCPNGGTGWSVSQIALVSAWNGTQWTITGLYECWK